MPVCLVDASALCKRYFTRELGSEVVDALFANEDALRCLPNISLLEVINAILRAQREGHVSSEEAEAFVAALFGDIAMGHLLLFTVNDDIVFNTEPVIRTLQSRRIIKKRPGPLDALLIACALEFDLDDLVLVSSDRDLNALAEHFGIRTLDPESPSPS